VSPAIPEAKPRWKASERAFNGGMRVCIDEVAKNGDSRLFKTLVDMQPDVAWDLADEGFIETKRMLMDMYGVKLPLALKARLAKQRCLQVEKGKRCTDFDGHDEAHDYEEGVFA